MQKQAWQPRSMCGDAYQKFHVFLWHNYRRMHADFMPDEKADLVKSRCALPPGTLHIQHMRS